MSQESEIFSREILDLLDEAFEQHHGIFLDKGTSLFQTLDDVSAEQASRTASPKSASIAAHVKHVTFYLNVLHAYMQNMKLGKVDWKEIWRSTKAVSPEQWDVLKKELRESYHHVLDTLEDMDDWNETAIAGSLAILAHTAYHLGAIRQALCVVK
jgi:uncharacterized damage-inducible protein DinB